MNGARRKLTFLRFFTKDAVTNFRQALEGLFPKQEVDLSTGEEDPGENDILIAADDGMNDMNDEEAK